MGMVDYLSGHLVFTGSTERLTAARYCALLSSVLAQTSLPLLVIHDDASYHTVVATSVFVAKHADRLSVHRLPS
jgi:hypothetical protein